MHSIEIKKYYSNVSVKILNVFVANIKRNIYTLSMEKTKFRKQDGRKCQYLDENGKWKSTGKDTIAEAKQWYYSGRGKEKITVAEFAENIMSDTSEGSYLNMLHMVERDNSNFFNYISNKNIQRFIIPYFGNMCFDEITPVIVQDWYNSMRKNDGSRLSSGYANNILNTLSTIFKWAIFRGVTSTNPTKSIIRRTTSDRGRRPYSHEELEIMFPKDNEKLIEIWGSKKIALYFLILRDTGWRPGEILALTPFDLIRSEKSITTAKSFNSFDKKVIDSIKTTKKGMKFKVGMLSDMTYDLFVEVSSDIEYDRQIFVDAYGTNYSSRRMLEIFKKTLSRLGIETEGRPQYALRTTFMTNISNTMSDEKVILLMGHKAWRSCYDQRNPEQVIKKLKTM